MLREHGLAHRGTLRVGRTHGIHAEPDVWGHRVADFAFAMARCRDRLARARDAVAVGKLSGPVGTYSNIDPAIEATVMPELGLRPADVATQVVFRDGIAEWVSALAVIATVCEAIALEVRHGQRTEVRELAEPFPAGQKGSSAMPHKKNPIRSERICGLARVVRGYVTPVMEGMPLWHERDISHSSVERVALPDAAIATDYLLHLTTGLVEGLVVDAARMRANLESTGGLIYTSGVLLELVAAGMSREDAYALVQAAAMVTWETGTPLRETLRARPPRGAARWTRPGWTRCAARSATSSGSGRSSTGWSGCHEPAAAARRERDPLKHLYSGKVREVYSCGRGRLLLVATDRVSAYDHVLPTPIPDKGKILTQLSLWWFGQLADLVPNHLVDAAIPAEFAGRAMACRRLSMVPVECVARGYLAGSGLPEYREPGRSAGWRCRPGSPRAPGCPSRSSPRRPRRPRGARPEHPASAVAATVGADVAAELERITLEVYRRGAAIAGRHGIIVADTKIELGFDPRGRLLLADEVLTPDSSRFWPAGQWRPGRPQGSFDKQIVRDWLDSPEAGWDKRDTEPPPPARPCGRADPRDLHRGISAHHRTTWE